MIDKKTVHLLLWLAVASLTVNSNSALPSIWADSTVSQIPNVLGANIRASIVNNIVRPIENSLAYLLPSSKTIEERQLTGGNSLSEDHVAMVIDGEATISNNSSSILVAAPADPDTHRNVKEIIESRGFNAEEHDVVTRDGYILTVQRIVNPLVDDSFRQAKKMKPVIMQHGLMSSSADWVINSVNVRPAPYPRPAAAHLDPTLSAGANDNDNNNDIGGDTQERPNSLGFYLANRGYDVWLANSRGNIYGQRHVNMSSWNLKFWDFTFDEQIEFDLPDIIQYVQQATNKTKVAYVGHSQGTVMGFGLLSERPEYADIIEPFVALAPVAYCSHVTSPVKYFSVYTPLWSHVNLWFATSNVAVKYLAPIVCGPEVIRKDLCANILFLSVGFDEEELDDARVSAYLNHTPSGTSVKNVAHYGQEVISGKFAKFDHGIFANLYKYGSYNSPSYDLSKIRSKSMALFTAENDWLAAPKDVARLISELKVPLYDHFNVTTVKPKWNHIDYVYGKDAGEIINPRIEKIMDAFREDN